MTEIPFVFNSFVRLYLKGRLICQGCISQVENWVKWFDYLLFLFIFSFRLVYTRVDDQGVKILPWNKIGWQIFVGYVVSWETIFDHA